MTLYHYTCGHRAPMIRQDQHIRPGNDLGTLKVPWSAFGWFTDMAVPVRDALGLTSYCLDCDRTEYRFTVLGEPAELVPWVSVRREYDDWGRLLESAPGARPRHWWVSPLPVFVTGGEHT